MIGLIVLSFKKSGPNLTSLTFEAVGLKLLLVTAFRQWQNVWSAPVPIWLLHFDEKMPHVVLRGGKFTIGRACIIVFTIHPIRVKPPRISSE